MTKQNEKDAKRVPELRFKGFTDDWEQVEFGKLGIISRGLTYRPNDVTDKNGVRVLRSSNIHEDSFVLNNNDVFVNSSTVKIHNVKNGDILVTSANGSSRLVGKHAIIKGLSNKTVHGGFMLAIRPATNSYFLNSLMSTSWYDNFISTFVSGGNGSIGNLKKSDLERQDIFIPLKQEQNKIGDIFYNLERTITLHEEKQRQLEQLKKALLQKMFADETGYPVLRFKGFTEKWEQVKLSKTSRSYSGGTPKVGVHEYYDGQIPFIRSGEIASKSTELTISKVGLNNSSAKLVSKGDILYALYGATSGEVSLSKINGAINQAILAIKPIDGYENYFLMTWLQKEKEQITRTYLQGGQGNLSAKIVMNLVVNIPSLSEQSQIAQIFSKLDKTITLHDKKIQYLKQLKRGLLQKMFV